MCKGAVAAPRPLQALVYPILQEKSLSFCEKIKKQKFQMKIRQIASKIPVRVLPRTVTLSSP